MPSLDAFLMLGGDAIGGNLEDICTLKPVPVRRSF
jgi:hypothetical protein